MCYNNSRGVKMAKGKNFLFSLQAKGQLGKKVIFQDVKGFTIAKEYKKSPVWVTDKQKAHKQVMIDVVDAWRNLSDEDKAKWNEYAHKQGIKTYSGYNWFWILNVSRVTQSLPPLQVPPGYEVPFEVIQEGLTLWYKFSEGEGTTTKDTVKELEASIINGSWVDGKHDKALEYNGVDSYVLIPDDESNRFVDKMSFFAWVKVYNLGSTMAVCKKDNHFGLWISSNGKFRVYHYSTYASRYKDSTQALSVNEWHYIGFTYDKNDAEGKNLRLYLDGQQVGYLSLVYDYRYSLRDVYLGKWGDTGTLYFDGIIDEVIFYNRALTPDEVLQNYNLYTGG